MQKFDDFLDKYLNEQDETFRSEYKKAKEDLEDLLEKIVWVWPKDKLKSIHCHNNVKEKTLKLASLINVLMNDTQLVNVV